MPMAELRERRPAGRDWIEIRSPLKPTSRSIAHSAWRSGPILVTSELAELELPDRSGIGLQWQIAISANRKRPKPHHVRRALRAFGMQAAEQDNHHPGVAQHFFLVVDPAHRVDCECKTDEEIIIEPDGYRWTNPIEGECRGCTIAPLTGKPCPIHAEGA